MNNNIIEARHKVATIARSYIEKKISWQQFMDSVDELSDDALIAELVDLIEHEPKRGGFMGVNESQWQNYQQSIQDIISQLELGSF
jgi:hypothetical protein